MIPFEKLFCALRDPILHLHLCNPCGNLQNMKAIGVLLLGSFLCFNAAAQRRIPEDLSDVRGFNYMSAEKKP